MATLRNFFMPEQDRYGYAEGLRRGQYMVAVDADETRAHQVMDLLEQHGAVDTTFVQFYPTLLPKAAEMKTFSAAYLAEEAAAKTK